MDAMTKEYASAWAQAFFDGEGTCFFSYRPGNRGNSVAKCISATNTDRELIDKCAECLDVLGIGYRVFDIKPPRQGCKPQWRVNIQVGSEILLYEALVGFTCLRKKASLLQMSAWIRRKEKTPQLSLALVLPEESRGA